MSKVLIVDDEKAVAEVICKFLQRAGLDASCFNYPREVLMLITEQKLQADVLLTDNDMPGMKGIELIQKVKEYIPGVKTILISGYPVDPEKLRSVGCDRFFLKPVGVFFLAELIPALLAGEK